MKRIVSFVFAAVMMLSLAVQPCAAQEVVNFWHTGGSGTLQQAVKYAVEKFNTTVGPQKKIKVVDTYIGGYQPLTAKLQLSVQAGEQPQVAIMGNTYVGWFMEDRVLADMMPYAKADRFDVSNIMAPFMLTMGNRNGQLHSVPFFRSTPLLYYNKGMARKAGLTPPTTIQELEAFAKALYKKDAKGEVQVWGFECLKDFGYFNAANLWQLGSAMFSEDGKRSPALEDGKMLKVLSDWRRWVDEGWCRPFDSTDQGAKLLELFYQGKMASFWYSCGGLRNIMKGASDAGIEVGVMPFTTYDRSKPVSEIGGGNVGIIGKGNSKKQIAAAWEFVKLLMSDDVVANTSIVTGYVPVTNSVARYSVMTDYWKTNPMARVAYDQLGTAIPQEFPYVPILQEFTVAIEDASSLLIQERSLTPVQAVEYIKKNTAQLFRK